jgi:hypothetical protein
LPQSRRRGDKAQITRSPPPIPVAWERPGHGRGACVYGLRAPAADDDDERGDDERDERQDARRFERCHHARLFARAAASRSSVQRTFAPAPWMAFAASSSWASRRRRCAINSRSRASVSAARCAGDSACPRLHPRPRLLEEPPRPDARPDVGFDRAAVAGRSRRTAWASGGELLLRLLGDVV